MSRYGKLIIIISAVMICAAGAILPFAFASSRERDEEAYSKKELLVNRVIDENDLHIGIGIGGGIVKFGEFGQSHRDLTAIGTVVNTAARAQTAAHAGQILVTATVRDRSKEENDIVYGEARKYHLKGLASPVDLYDARGLEHFQQ